MAIKRHLKGLATKTAVQRQAVPLPAGPGELLSFQSGKDRLPGQETKVQSLEEEDPPEEEMATHSSVLAWIIPWTEEPGGCIVHGVTKSQT